MNLPDVGRIAVGCRADAVLVESNPLADLNALRKPLKVFKDGHGQGAKHDTARSRWVTSGTARIKSANGP